MSYVVGIYCIVIYGVFHSSAFMMAEEIVSVYSCKYRTGIG